MGGIIGIGCLKNNMKSFFEIFRKGNLLGSLHNEYSEEELEKRNLYFLEKSSGILREQKYSNLIRKYYHISDKKFKSIREFGEGSTKLAFFSLDPKFCFAFSKLRFPGGSNVSLYLYKCYLKQEVNIFNLNQKTSVEKLLLNDNDLIQLYNQIPDKKNHKLFWEFLENSKVINKIARMNCYDGIAIDFFVNGLEDINTMGLALFNANKMRIHEFAEVTRDNFDIDSIEWKSIFEEKIKEILKNPLISERVGEI
jgi:hypothetical protein